MTPFTDLLAALDEADYLAAETHQRHAIVALPDARFGVVPLTDAYANRLTVLEVLHP